jgi:hypothetical protein
MINAILLIFAEIGADMLLPVKLARIIRVTR